MHLVSLACEIGMVMVAMVSALSNSKHPSFLNEGRSGTLHRTIALAVLSCFASVVTSWMSIVGFAGVMNSVRRISHVKPVAVGINAAARTGERLRRMSALAITSTSSPMGASSRAGAGSGHGSVTLGVTPLPVKASAVRFGVQQAEDSKPSNLASEIQSSALGRTDSFLDALCAEEEQNAPEDGRNSLLTSSPLLAVDCEDHEPRQLPGGVV